MRFVIFISAVIIAAAIDLDYCESRKIPLYFVGGSVLGWDIFELLLFSKRK